MKSNLTNEDLVSRYLDNEMSDVEKLDFEQRLETDPQLKKEFSFQNELVTAIKEHRRMELKARLARIDVPAPFIHAIGLKIAAVATATIIIGSGIYYAVQNRNSSIEPSKIDLRVQQITPEEENIAPSIPEVKIKPVTPTETAEKVAKRGKKKAGKETPTTAAKQKVTKPKVVRPDMNIDFDDEVSDENMAEETEAASGIEEVKTVTESKMEVETVKDKRHRFHYKFYNNRLYLLGDFSKSPYEIIELNSGSGKKYFLYYQNNYYQLKTDRQKPTPLNKVENDSIIKELSIIQKYK